MKNLLRDIFIAGFADEREGQQEHICTSITQRPQPVIILLSCIHQTTLSTIKHSVFGCQKRKLFQFKLLEAYYLPHFSLYDTIFKYNVYESSETELRIIVAITLLTCSIP